MTEFALSAELRADLGKGASRRLRRNANLVPAVIYGGDKEPVSISLKTNEVAKLFENEAAFSHVITLNIGDATESVLVKALQRHPAKEFIMHADFIRVLADHKLTAHVPLHFINQETSVGVKQQGGEASHTLAEVEVSCLPANLPEFIEVDMAAVEVGQTVHMSDLKLPEGVELVSLAHGNDLGVANIHASRVKAEDDAAEGEGEAAE